MNRLKIDYDMIITTNFRNLIDIADYIDIKLQAEEERNCLKRKFDDRNPNYGTSYAYEIAYISSKYKNLSKVEKALLSANVNFTNSQYLRVVNDNNLTYEKLYNYIKLLDYIKNKKQYSVLNEKDRLYEKRAELISQTLIKKFAVYQHRPNINIIINKTTEILSYYSNLLTKEDEKIDFIVKRR